MAFARRTEYACQRKMRNKNKRVYRLMHWPIWVLVFFFAPGPLTLNLFAGRGNLWNILWLVAVLLGTGVAVLRGWLPGTEPIPYILRSTEDRPNPLYRRICYAFAWNAALSFAMMNLIGLVVAVLTGRWHIQLVYETVSFPVFLFVVLLGVAGKLPRVGSSTRGEAAERRVFYGTVWAVTAAQTVLLVLCTTLARSHTTDVLKLAIYLTVLASVALAATQGRLPRTRPILPGEFFARD